MPVSYSQPTFESVMHEIISLYYRGPTGLPDESRKSKQIKEAYQRGVREGIALILFTERGKSFPRFSTIEAIFESDVHVVLRDYENEYMHTGGADKHIVRDTIFARLQDLVAPVVMQEEYENLRREDVLAGFEPVRPDDVEWLDKLIEQEEAKVIRLRNIAEGKVAVRPEPPRVEKVPPRVLKDIPQA